MVEKLCSGICKTLNTKRVFLIIVKLIKQLRGKVLTVLTQIYRAILEVGQLPSLWKVAKIIKIPNLVTPRGYLQKKKTKEEYISALIDYSSIYTLFPLILIINYLCL